VYCKVHAAANTHSSCALHANVVGIHKCNVYAHAHEYIAHEHICMRNVYVHARLVGMIAMGMCSWTAPQEKNLRDMRFIEAVIDAKLAFSITENPAAIALFKQLRPAYELPSILRCISLSR